jgi:hypothetical protein
MPAPYVGQCLCGATAYRVNEEPLTYYACHCTDCQRRTGTAFALSMIVRRGALELLRGEPGFYLAMLPDGRRKAGRLCSACGTRLWGDPRIADIAVVQAGTLEQPCGLEPVAHIWTRSAQPWLVWPADARRYETQPAQPGELARLWRERAAGGARPHG